MHRTINQPSRSQRCETKNCRGRVAAWIGNSPRYTNAFAVQLGHAIRPATHAKVRPKVDNLGAELEQFGANRLGLSVGKREEDNVTRGRRLRIN